MTEQISQVVQIPAQVQQQAKQKPLDKFNNSGVSTAIWPNQIMVNNQPKTILKATLQKRFKDKDGNWKNSNSFSKNEIQHAIHCLKKAYDKIVELENALKANTVNGNGAVPAGDINTPNNVNVAGNGMVAAGYA